MKTPKNTARQWPASDWQKVSIVARAVLLFVGPALTFGCSIPAPPVESKPPAVTVVAAIAEVIVDYDELVGRTEASETVVVRSRVSGLVKTIAFLDGDRVEQDQLLFKIEPDLYQAIHQQSLSRIDLLTTRRDLAASKLKRSQSLSDSRAISKEELEEAVAAFKESEAAIVAARADADRTALDVKYTQIRAEIAGRIDRALVTPGNMVTGGLGSGTLLTRIVRNDPMYAYVDVDERSILRYLRRVNPGNSSPDLDGPKSLRERRIPCSMQLADEPDFPHEGFLDFVENRVNSDTGSIQIRGAFNNPNQFLTGGLFVRIRVPVSDPYQAILIPEQSIGTDQGTKFAYVVGDDNVPVRRELVLGAQRGTVRVVVSGIEAGQRVIFRGMQRVRPGQPVAAELAPLPTRQPPSSIENLQTVPALNSNIDESSSTPKT